MNKDFRFVDADVAEETIEKCFRDAAKASRNLTEN